MLYFIVRLSVNFLAVGLTMLLLPGIAVNLDVTELREIIAEVATELEAVRNERETALGSPQPDATGATNLLTTTLPAVISPTQRITITVGSGAEQEDIPIADLPSPEVLRVIGFLIELGLKFVVIFALALAFGFWNWLLWPIALVVTGRVLLWSFGLFLIVVNALLFYFVAFVFGAFVRADEPVWFWAALGGLVLTGLLLFFEGITGLNSPLKDKATRKRRYWRLLDRFTFGGRNVLAENVRIGQLLDTITRYLKDIFFDLSPFGPIRRFFQRLIYRGKHPYINETTPEMVRYLLQDLGPTFVKLGQIVSSRAEQLPPDWRQQLAKLQSQVEPFPWPEAQRIITQELGEPPEQLYAQIEETPLAAASTAQVHRATMADGDAVVVKVQRPDIDVTVRADLNVMRDLTQLLTVRMAWARAADLDGIMNEYADNILLELDYTNEAFNGRLLAQNMALFPEIHVPHIYGELATRRVMTQEFVRGVKITDTAALDAAGVDRTRLAEVFMRAIVKQVLYDGFFHGDPHPGNVLVDTDTQTIIFLDMGMMGTLATEKRLAMIDLLWSLSERDPQAIGRVILRLTNRTGPIDEHTFLQDVEQLLRRYLTFSDASLSISAAVQALFAALNRNGLRLDADLTLALKAMMQAEETVSRLDPELPLVATAFAATKELLRETFDADQVFAALRRQAIRSAKEAIRNIPSIEAAALKWITSFQKGGVTLYVDTTELSQQVKEIERTVTRNVRRLIVALMLVGLLIGAAIASTSSANILPNLPEIAYFIFIGAAVIACGAVLRTVWNWLNGREL